MIHTPSASDRNPMKVKGKRTMDGSYQAVQAAPLELPL